MTQETIAEAQRAIQQGRVDEAERLLRGAVQDDPQSIDAHMALAAVLTRKEDHAGATESFANAMRIDRAREGLALSYAISCFRAGRYSEAEKSASLAVQNEPSAAAYDALACALREQGKSVEALAAADNALRLAPASNAAQNTKASILLATGRHAEALAMLEALNNRGVTAPAITLNRGEALEKLGRAQEAKRLYAEASLAWTNFARLQRERAQRRH
jgi:predicted Zn-dependent protease